jgi:uncharacterized protein (TIGR03437 family)
MKGFWTTGLLVCMGISAGVALAATASPAINAGGILNAASYAPDGMPNSGIALGSQFVIFGSNLGATGLHTASSYPLPVSLQQTSVRVTVKGATVSAIMVYTSPGQVGAILPSSTPVGDGAVVVTYNGVDSAPATIRVHNSQFGIFTRNSGGSGPAIVQNVNNATDEPVNSLSQSLQPGQLAVLWGTGLGPVTGNEAGGPLPGDLKTDLTVLVGSQQAPVVYRGRSGCCAGVDQVIFQVPQGVSGCYVPLAVMIENAVSNFTSISIAPKGGTCSDPHGLSAADLQDLSKGNDLRVGSVELFRAILNVRMPGSTEVLNLTQDVGAAGFYRFNPNAAAAAEGLVGVAVRGFSGMAPYGSCNVYPLVNGDLGSVTDPVQPGALEAGGSIKISGPGGARSMDESDPGVYSGQLGGSGALGFAGDGGTTAPPYLDPGDFTIDSASGGSDVGPFHATITVPAVIGWSNAAQIGNIDRSKDLTATWTGGDPTKEFIVFAGISFDNVLNNGEMFVCTERAGAHTFTAPSYVLSALPAGKSLIQDDITGLLWLGNISLLQQNRITTPGLSAGFLFYLLFQFQNVTFQ